MTYKEITEGQRHRASSECPSADSSMKSSLGKRKISTIVMRPLNSELTFGNDRKSHLQTAADDQLNSSLRCDVEQTTDLKAFVRLLEYVKSDIITLDTHKDSEIAKFYAGRSVFITGASGFVGKKPTNSTNNQCLLEKLLRSCPDIKETFILMRPKRGRSVDERVDDIIRSELFDRLRCSPYGRLQFNKIKPIKGDITESMFGLRDEDIGLLASRVSIIFHSAATVKFVEPLKVAVENNVVSVDNLINLAGKFRALEALVHVSTAYSNCDRKQVDEVLYETPIEASKLIDMAKWMDPKMFEKIAPVLLGKRPNTYTYTKAVAESLLIDRSRKLLPNVPIAMVRPSIVAGIWRQPICGWVDNFNGPTGVILSMMTGAIQAMLACPNYCADIVPVDIVANLLICTAWQIHEQNNGIARASSEKKCADDNITNNSNKMSIFNCVSGTLNPVAWSDFAKYIKQIGLVYPCNNVMRVPGTLLLSNEYIFNTFNFINHTLVAYGGDLFLKIMGKKPTLVIVYNRLMKMIDTLKPFTTNQWLFNCTNVTCLYERMSLIDKEIFNFDIRQVRWDEYLRRYYVGSKIYALKDDPSQVVEARQKLRMIKLRGGLFQLFVLLVAYYFLLSGTLVEQSVLATIGHTCVQLTSGIFSEPENSATNQLET